ncbi:hypothetical protein [Streptomyces chattanoogensis]|uniref:Uncharacterized protein n=1 Tax=Streptomyces chattanoogensis TaxID=66876 RepID=A0A0N0XUP5_9ACTN|nr:hypothetical protein [Streptomyces chattanoogensis]KPC62258.1 hypothetical protein ADL29_21120 [Streptomyces chattanoogensis]
METIDHTTAAAGHLHQPHTQRAFGAVKKCVAGYGALGVAVLLVDVILSVKGHKVSSFMWGRTGGVLASAVVAYWLTGLAARGSRSAYLRVRIMSVVAPLAIVAIDSIPGALPPWFVAMQIAGALVLAPAAFLTNGSGLRAAFPKSSRRS